MKPRACDGDLLFPGAPRRLAAPLAERKPGLGMIDTRRAVLCVEPDCPTIYDLREYLGRCPACGSMEFVLFEGKAVKP